MSFSTNDILNSGGPGSSAEPSMEEILASIRRILKEDDTVKAAPVDLDDDILVLDQSMIARPADMGSVTYMPVEPPPAEPPAVPLQSSPEPLHFSSEPTPFAEDFIPAPEEPAAPAYEPVAAMPPEAAAPAYQPLIADPPSYQSAALQTAPLQAAPVPAAFMVPEPPPVQAAPEQAAPLRTAPKQSAPVSYPPTPPPVRPEPPQLEAKMPEPIQENVEPPHSIISEKTTDAAASSIGALVRSMSMEKSVAVSRHSVTIEEIVREEIRPLLKAWLDTHLPSLVERVVRSEIERVIDRSGT